MVVYKCLFCYYETIKKTSMRDHYNKNKKCYKEEDIINYENLENLIIKSKEENNLIVKRPGTGISPMEWDNILGQSANKDYYVDDLIER